MPGWFVLFFDLFQPPAEHLPDFLKWFGNKNIFFIIERFNFPENLQEKFGEIELSACPFEVYRFSFF